MSLGLTGDIASHGICETCYHSFIVKRQVALSQLLDGINLPVIALDAGVTALRANQAAARAVGKTVELIEGSLAGNVFECI
jgi:transcriptional regulator of aromatic amino acid metabolism